MECKTEKMLFVILSLTLFYVKSTLQESESQSTVKIFSGLFLEKQEDLIPYETSVPLIYLTNYESTQNLTLKSAWPTTNMINTSYLDPVMAWPTTNRIYTSYLDSVMNKNLHYLQDLIVHELQDPITDIYLKNVSNTQKQRRAINFIGRFLKFCCNTATMNEIGQLYQNQKDLTIHANEIIDSVELQHRDMVHIKNHINNITGEMNNVTDKIQKTMKLLQEEIKELSTNENSKTAKTLYTLIQQTWSFIYYSLQKHKVGEIREKCHLNLLSELAIKPDTLIADLASLKRKAMDKGLELAIPLTNIFLYYKLPITSCIINNATLLINMQIPLRTAKIKYDIYKTINTPLAWENLICTLHDSEDLIVKTDNYTKVLTNNAKGCDEKSKPLCKLPRETVIASLEHKCLNSILKREQIADLIEKCQFTCKDQPDWPIVTTLYPNTFLITNAKENVEIKCTNGSVLHLSNITVGTMRVTIPCQCELHFKDNILITKIQPCDEVTSEQFEAAKLIPAIWSNLRTLTLFPIESGLHYEFNRLDEILNQNWHVNTPPLYINNNKTLQHVQLTNDGFDIFNNTEIHIYILAVWSLLITIVLLITIYCLHIQSIKLKCLRPNPVQQDY